jgi:hypothetical protein
MQDTWQKTLEFDFDSPKSEYNFSTRLAKENYWTKNFTAKAIVEYKKFMYLAATSDLMVSPSEVIDIVWHQHLVFTQSYRDFCGILGKQIQHVPSTHNTVDFEKFKAAKDRTFTLYHKQFGQPPHEVWSARGMYETLNLEKAKIKVRSFILFGLLAFALLTIPAYFILRPLYANFGNPNFPLLYIGMSVAAIIFLRIYNRMRVDAIVSEIHNDSFLFNLHPFEVAYLKTKSVETVINGTLNQLAMDKKIKIDDKTFKAIEGSEPNSLEEHQVLDTIRLNKKISYNSLVEILKKKPVFSNTQNALDALTKYFVKSKKFGGMFYLNFGVLGIVLILGFVRLASGLLRDKPVAQIGFIIIIIAILVAIMLARLPEKLASRTFSGFYKENLKKINTENLWEWDYAIRGSSVLLPTMVALVALQSSSSSSDSSSSSSSSCGSSCSSCGGCGGGD